MKANKAVEIKSCCQLTVNNFGSRSCLCLLKRNINPTHNYVSRKSELAYSPDKIQKNPSQWMKLALIVNWRKLEKINCQAPKNSVIFTMFNF